LYTLDYAVAETTLNGITEERACSVASPIVLHAASAHLYDRQVIRNSKGEPMPVGKIGVSLFSARGVHTKGLRVSRTLAQLKVIASAH
jgi:hypothetical protein